MASFASVLKKRLIVPIEWLTDTSYGRSFKTNNYTGQFTATFVEDKHYFLVAIDINEPRYLHGVLTTIRRVLDLDADTTLIEQHLSTYVNGAFPLTKGLRIAGIWSPFEAGIRAVLGQQVSVTAAHNLVTKLVSELGEVDSDRVYFPTPKVVAASGLSFFKMPQARKNALINLADFCLQHPDCVDLDQWLSLKGVGPWTVNYAKLRGQSQPDILLGGDLGVKKAQTNVANFDADACSPFRTYLTFQLWQQLV